MLIIPRSILNKMIDHVKAHYPREVCGVMIGYSEGTKIFVRAAIPLSNLSLSQNRFWFDEREWMKIIIEFSKKGLDYIGIYHSHPDSSPLPSMNDLERMLECPGEIWVIVSYSPPNKIDIKAWTIPSYYSGVSSVLLLISSD